MRKLLVLLLVVGSLRSLGQGCSDAGFCTMGAMKPDQNFSREINFKLRSIGIQYYRGKTTLTPIIDAVTLEVNLGINAISAVQIKLPYQKVSGTLGQTEGLGDISLSYTRTLFQKKTWDLNLSVGGKIPTGDSRKRAENGLTLPMYYQTTLGSYDIIGGLSIISRKWLIAAGYQQALTSNSNDFTYGEWVRFLDKEYLGGYDVGIGLRRGTDVMLRVERNFRFLNYSFNLGVLPIYRVTKDQGIIRTRENGAQITTTGLALSTLGGFTYHFDVSNSVKLIYGYKLIDRNTNPDGLTRDWVFNATYEIRF